MPTDTQRAPGEAEMDANDRAPYRLWPAYMPFRKNGTPVVTGFGATARHVVIMDADTFTRLVAENPNLATACFEVASYE